MAPRPPAASQRITSRELGLFAAVALVVATLVVAAFVALRPAVPASDTGSAKLHFRFPKLDGPKVAYDAELMRSEMACMFSNHVLQAVVENLSLTNQWQADNSTNLISIEDAVEKLKRSARVRQIPKTTVLEVSVASPDPEESAALANSLAEAYVQDFEGRERDRMSIRLRELLAQRDAIAQAAQQADTHLAELIRDAADSNMIFEASLQVTNARRALNMIAEKVEEESTELLTFRGEKLLVTIMDRAEPRMPTEQRRQTINWTRAYLTGGLLGLLTGIGAIIWSRFQAAK